MVDLNDTVFLSLYKQAAQEANQERQLQQAVQRDEHRSAADALRSSVERKDVQRGKERELAMKMGSTMEEAPSIDMFKFGGSDRVAGAPKGMPFLGGSEPEPDKGLGGMARLGFELARKKERDMLNDPRFALQDLIRQRQLDTGAQKANARQKLQDAALAQKATAAVEKAALDRELQGRRADIARQDRIGRYGLERIKTRHREAAAAKSAQLHRDMMASREKIAALQAKAQRGGDDKKVIIAQAQLQLGKLREQGKLTTPPDTIMDRAEAQAMRDEHTKQMDALQGIIDDIGKPKRSREPQPNLPDVRWKEFDLSDVTDDINDPAIR